MYSKKVMDHFMNPRNVGSIPEANGIGEVGNLTCGDIMHIEILVKDNIIDDIKFQTYGCAAAIATSSMITEMVKGMTIEEALIALKNVGLDTMTGASAEILVDSVRARICPNKVTTQEWVDVIKEAHKLGIPTTSTLMYGTVENWEDRVDHLLILRDIQRETHGFTEIVPMTFLGKNNILGTKINPISGMDDMKMHAIARIILGEDIPNIQASWIKLGTKLAQIALCCGANDLGGTMMEDKISIAAGASYGEHLPREDMNQIITDIGRVPVERDTIYQRVG